MSFKSLLEPITENGIKNINFFEGRLLSGKDLSEQEEANKIHIRQLGKVLGHGVVEGLQVSIENVGTGADVPRVRIKKGMAITLDGDIVELPLEYIDIELSRSFDTLNPDQTGFKDCSNLPSETLVPSGAGLYILVMSPTQTYREYAPKSGLQKSGIAQNCGRAYVIEGVQFRLVKFNPSLMPSISNETRTLLEDRFLNISSPVGSADPQELSMMRNLVAHVCFGTDGITTSAQDPDFISRPTTMIGLDALLGLDEGLANCDTSLALIYWNLEGIAFVDNWAVKRKASHRDIVGYNVPSFTRQSYSRADELRLQFQEHIADLKIQVSDLANFNVIKYFRYLPPVGILPLRVEAVSDGFTETEFFKDLTVRGSVYFEAASLVPITQVAMTYWPIDLQSQELIWLYRSRENAQQADINTSQIINEYLIFTTGHSPYFGNARFDVAKYDYSNYGFI